LKILFSWVPTYDKERKLVVDDILGFIHTIIIIIIKKDILVLFS
jgi:hypothetical protein